MSVSKGGRPRGTRGRRHDNLFKRCPHRRRDWATCGCPWHFRMFHDGRDYPFVLYKVAGKSRGYNMSKTEAETLRDRLRADILSGTLAERFAVKRPTTTGVTFADVAARYLEARQNDPSIRPHRHKVLANQLELIKRTHITATRDTHIAFGALVFEDIRRHHLDAFREARRRVFRDAERKAAERRAALAAKEEKVPPPVGVERPGAARGETGINRSLEVLRHLFSWAIRHDFREHESPFRRKGEPDMDMAKEQARTRRLHDGEEKRLMLAANPHLRDCIEGALETGLRRGEMLALQWQDVRCDAGGNAEWIVLRHETTKTDRSRTIPVSAILAALLKRRRLDPKGDAHALDACVFGNAVGEKLDSVKTAWRATCRRAKIDDLHFHDLRREAACRWFEAGVPLHHIRDLLGHADISTTSRYLAVTPTELQRSMRLAEDVRKARQSPRPSRSDARDHATAAS